MIIKTDKIIPILIVCLLILGGLFVYVYISDQAFSFLIINNSKIQIEIADTEQKRTLGLSNRSFLPENSGMLFVFDKPDYYSFWMKDMFFPLDFIWIDQNLRIIDITKNVDPKTYPEIFKPKMPAQYVLEVNAWWADKLQAKIGDQIFFYH